MNRIFKFLVFVGLLPALHAADRPNILWLTSEDHSPTMGCYGDPNARTPNVDALAARGMLFKRAWSCAPVCAAARTTIISGMYPPSLGAEHMRSEVALPAGVKMYPQFLREAGYHCTNPGKKDYNLTEPAGTWDTGTWKSRAKGQPFFAVFNAQESHESQIHKSPHTQVLDPAKVRVPAYHPDTPEVRKDWAQYYDQLTVVDAAAGERLKEIAEAGLAEDTIVFYYADHGSGMPRSKRWPSNSGLHVPMVVYFPEKWRHLAPKEYQAGGKSDRLVSFVDLAPTLLSIAGIEPPKYMQGHAFAGKFQTAPQPFIYGFRGRMDERYDLVRTVTDGRYVYLRNYLPHLSQAQHVGTQFGMPTTKVWFKLFEEGKLDEAQSIFWKVPKAPEELYDLENDRDEVRNLAASPDHQAILKKLRQAQEDLAVKTRDTGFLTEAEVHARSGKQSPRDALAADSAYAFKDVFAAADKASLMQSSSLPVLKGYLKHPDSGVRYWGALGIRMLGKPAVDSSRDELTQALDDSSPSVRIAAADALGTYGSSDDLPKALAALQAVADPTKTSAYTGILALNIIDGLGTKAAPLKDFIKTMPTNDPNALTRGNDYVPRLQKYLNGDSETKTPKAAKNKNREKRKKQ